MAPVEGIPSSGATQGVSPVSPETIPGPTVLFWVVCFALNAMSEPSGSVCGLGYEPHWLLRMSPIMSLFDGLHMVGSWLRSYFKHGKSGHLATAETLLGRLVGGNALSDLRSILIARNLTDDMKRAAASVEKVIPREAVGTTTVLPREIEKAKKAVKDLISRTIIAGHGLDGVIYQNEAQGSGRALEEMRDLLPQATETALLLEQLIVSGDSATQKEEIRRAMLPYRSSVEDARDHLERFIASRNITKARTLLKDLTISMGFRWFGFGLGVLPQLIKLFGSSGLGLFQAYGAMYLFPWVTFEGLVVAAKFFTMDESEAAWSPVPEYARKRDDDITPSSHQTTDRGTESTVSRSSNAAIFGQQADGGNQIPKEGKAVATMAGPTPDKDIINDLLFSVFLGAMGCIGHITTCIALIQDTRATHHTPSGGLGKNLATTSSLAVVPVWINNLGFSLHNLQSLEGALAFTFITMSVLAIFKLFLTVSIALAAGDKGSLAPHKYLLYFVGVSLVARLHIGSVPISEAARLNLMIVLRVLFSSVPLVYFFLVRYEEQGTKQLSWAEWLG
ncbi:hypothetical protein GGR56DRAFT_618253 [Xylariaceae sp. FL0804]|nr:hypothetical protein GGR56DRAFT_618253 [Xylariaceae sp. FL0804]